jgi:hypothetical protein
LNDVGFATYYLAKLFSTDEDVRELREDFGDLPADPYAAGSPVPAVLARRDHAVGV